VQTRRVDMAETWALFTVLCAPHASYLILINKPESVDCDTIIQQFFLVIAKGGSIDEAMPSNVDR
jgi:hypothetical protein